MMNRYRVVLTEHGKALRTNPAFTDYFEGMEIEADNETDAWAILRGIDGPHGMADEQEYDLETI